MVSSGRIVVLPTRNLQELVLRAVARGRTRYNYAVAFRDVAGWGVSLGDADWVRNSGGRPYVQR